MSADLSPAVAAPESGLTYEREKFEVWAEANNFTIHRDESDKYRDYHRATTRFAWEAWQARAALSTATSLSPSLPVEIHGKCYDVPIAVQVYIVSLKMQLEEASTPPAPATSSADQFGKHLQRMGIPDQRDEYTKGYQDGLASATSSAGLASDAGMNADAARFRWLLDEAQAQHWRALSTMPDDEREYIDAAMKGEQP